MNCASTCCEQTIEHPSTQQTTRHPHHHGHPDPIKKTSSDKKTSSEACKPDRFTDCKSVFSQWGAQFCSSEMNRMNCASTCCEQTIEHPSTQQTTGHPHHHGHPDPIKKTSSDKKT